MAVREQMPQLKLIDEEDELRERVLAAKAFNARHVSRSTRARGLLCTLDSPEQLDWAPLGHGFNRGVREVFRNRFWMAEQLVAVNAIAPSRRRRRHRWRLADSIWAPRKLYGNSLDYYETDESMRTLFDTDWELASVAIAKMVERSEDLGEEWVDADDNGRHDSVDDIGEALWVHRAVVYGAFDYYACLMTNKLSSTGEVDIFAIGYNAFTEFARDCGLIGAACPLRTLDLIWTSCNVMSHEALKRLRLVDRWNHSKTMSRHEFQQAIVRLANALYVATGVESTVASAVVRLCLTLRTTLPPEALQDSNEFRRQCCYNEHTDRELVPWEESLRALFRVYARSNADVGDELQDQRTMSVGEWLSFLRHFDLLDTGQISYFGAKMVFKWSLIRSRPDHTAASERKMRQLTFIDFVEALVRVACLMGLPTDASAGQIPTTMSMRSPSSR